MATWKIDSGTDEYPGWGQGYQGGGGVRASSAGSNSGLGGQWGSNPEIPQNYYSGFLGQIQDISGGLWDSLKGGWNPNGSGSGGGGWGSSFAMPNDPIVGGYMDNLSAGSQALSNQYIDQAVNKGSSRGGMMAAGGADPQAQAQLNATRALGQDYRNNYTQAMDWTNKIYGGWADNWKSGMNALSGILNTQLGAVQGEGNLGAHYWDALNANNQRGIDYERSVADREAGWGREDELDTRNWERGADQRAQQQKDWTQQNIESQRKNQDALRKQQKDAQFDQAETDFWDLAERGPSYWSANERYMMQNLAPWMGTSYGIQQGPSGKR